VSTGQFDGLIDGCPPRDASQKTDLIEAYPKGQQNREIESLGRTVRKRLEYIVQPILPAENAIDELIC